VSSQGEKRATVPQLGQPIERTKELLAWQWRAKTGCREQNEERGGKKGRKKRK